MPAARVGEFHQRPVSPALRAVFDCVWRHRLPEGGVPPVIVIPDGTIDLQWIDGCLRVAGPDKEPQTEILTAGTDVVGLRFHAGAASAWLGLPASEIVGQRVNLTDIWGARARALSDRIRNVDDIEQKLAQYRPVHRPADPQMRAAAALIAQGPPPDTALVPWLGRALHLSERSLRRRFDENFGYGPKTLDRILRYQRFLRLQRASPTSSTVRLALDAGYADQAHLVRESRRLTGLTPRTLLAS